MLKGKEIGEIALLLWYLPLDQVAAIRESVLKLKQECGYREPTDDSDEWTREDEQDLTRATLQRGQVANPWPEENLENEGRKDAQAG